MVTNDVFEGNNTAGGTVLHETHTGRSAHLPCQQKKRIMRVKIVILPRNVKSCRCFVLPVTFTLIFLRAHFLPPSALARVNHPRSRIVMTGYLSMSLNCP